MPIEFQKLTSTRIRQLPRGQTVFFFAAGGFEDRGPHLPVGLGLREAETLCRKAAERLEKEKQGWVGVLMPPLPIAVDTVSDAVAIRVRPYVLRDGLVDSCRSLMREGFLHFVCFSGTLSPKTLTAIEEAGKIVSRSGLISWIAGRRAGTPTLVSACSPLITGAQVKASPWWLDPIEHGGVQETSVALAVAPGEVDLLYTGLPPREREEPYSARWIKKMRHQIEGYWGNPAAATEARGAEILQEKLDLIFPKLRAVWEGSNPNALFRSWYSILPVHKTAFKAWALAVGVGIFLTLWVYINLQALLS